MSAPRNSRPSITAEHAGPSSFPIVSHPLPYTAQRTLVVGTALSHPPPHDWPRSPFPPSHVSDSSDSSGSDDANEVTNFGDPVTIVPWNEVSRIEPQISGFLDPFSQHPSNFAPEIVNLCESYCVYCLNIPNVDGPPTEERIIRLILTKFLGITVLWPGLVPNSGSQDKKAGELWFPLSLSDPALFTAFMFGSLCHQRVQWLKGWVPGSSFGPKEQRILQLCEMESIKLISQAVKDPTRAVSDAVLLSVICMAHHQALEESPDQYRKTPFTPPFQRLQWLDVYGHLPPNMIHIHGLAQLLKMRGGLKNIKLHGLRSTICL